MENDTGRTTSSTAEDEQPAGTAAPEPPRDAPEPPDPPRLRMVTGGLGIGASGPACGPNGCA